MLLGACIGATVAAALEASGQGFGRHRALDLGRVKQAALTGACVGVAGSLALGQVGGAQPSQAAPLPPVARLSGVHSPMFESSSRSVDPNSLRPGQEALLDPQAIRFDAAKSEERRRAAEVLRERVKEEGWGDDPVDVVLTRSGPVALDGTRVAVARELELESIAVRVHAPEEKLPSEVAQRFGPRVKTWGDALQSRLGPKKTGKQQNKGAGSAPSASGLTRRVTSD